VPVFRPVGSAVTVRLNVPVFGVVHGAADVHAGETFSQPELVVEIEKAVAAPPPERVTTCGVGLGSPTE
jgi:hypothetical protein